MRNHTVRRKAICLVLVCLVCLQLEPSAFSRHGRRHRLHSSTSERNEIGRDATNLAGNKPVEALELLTDRGVSLSRSVRDGATILAIETILSSLQDHDAALLAQRLHETFGKLGLSSEVKQQLTALIKHLEEVASGELREKLIAALKASDWTAVQGLAERGNGFDESGCLPYAKPLLNEALLFAKKQRALAMISAMTQSADGSSVPDAESLELVPASLREDVRSLEQLEKLLRLTHPSSSESVTQTEWTGLLNNLSALILENEQENAQKFVLDLSIHVFLRGDAHAAMDLLDSDGPADYRNARLQELHSFLVGRGEIRAWPLRPYLADNPQLPVALQQLIPTAHRDRWPADLELLPQAEVDSRSWVASVCSQQRAQLQSTVEDLQQGNRLVRQRLLADLELLQQETAAFLSARERRLASIEDFAGRKLSPIESLVAGYLDCQSRSAEDILVALNSLRRDNDRDVRSLEFELGIQNTDPLAEEQ